MSELALWCAGNYADSGWFTATGDLMFNPRRKFLTRKNSSELIELDRHKPISEQAGCRGLDRGSMIHRLKSEFRLVVEKKALIPELCQRLKQHPIPSPPYLKQVESRMTRISSTLSFQSTINLPRGMDLENYIRLLDERERENLESNLCRFNLSLFSPVRRVDRDQHGASRGGNHGAAGRNGQDPPAGRLKPPSGNLRTMIRPTSYN